MITGRAWNLAAVLASLLLGAVPVSAQSTNASQSQYQQDRAHLFDLRVPLLVPPPGGKAPPTIELFDPSRNMWLVINLNDRKVTFDKDSAATATQLAGGILELDPQSHAPGSNVDWLPYPIRVWSSRASLHRRKEDQISRRIIKVDDDSGFGLRHLGALISGNIVF